MKRREKAINFVGESVKLEGKLTFEGTLRINGYFKGEISGTGNLIVGEEALIEARISASNVVIIGEIHGDIISQQKVDIRAPGRVFGNILASTVIVEQGAILEGKTSMYQAKEARKESGEKLKNNFVL